MKTSKTLLSVAFIALLATSTAWAQNAPTREEVKKEAAAANKAGAVPKGEADASQSKADTSKSTASRSAVKAEAAAANKAGDIKCGEGGVAVAAAGKSTASRDAVKADAVKANKAGEISCGEGAPGAKK